MTIQPTLQSTSPPSLQNILDAHKREVQKSINCARIGIIKSFDPDKQTATVMIAQQQVTSISPAGVRTIQEYPLLLVVPVYFPSGGGFTLTFPIAEGDECLVVFNDRELDNWLSTGAGSTPTTSRVHDLSDGIAFVGLRSNQRALGGVSTTTTQLRSDDGTTYMEVGPGRIRHVATNINIEAGAVVTIGADGTGLRITPSGIESFTDGTTPTHTTPTPPRVTE